MVVIGSGIGGMGTVLERPLSRASNATSVLTTLNLPSRSDIRTPTAEPLKDTISTRQDVFSIQWHPIIPNLFAYGTDSNLVVIRVDIQGQDGNDSEETDENITQLNFTTVCALSTQSSAEYLEWSPLLTDTANHEQAESAYSTIVGVACVDSVVRVFCNLSAVPIELCGHLDLINGLAFGATQDESCLISSVSNDCTCRIWNYEDMACLHVIPLESPGVSTSFHSQIKWLMIAMRNGKIIFIHPETREVMMTLSSNGLPLTCVDWHRGDLTRLSATSGSTVLTWRIVPGKLASLPDYTSESKAQNGLRTVKYSPSGEYFAATLMDFMRVKVGSGRAARHVFPIHIFKSQNGSFPYLSLITPPSNGMAKVDEVSWTKLSNNTTIIAGCSNQHIYFWKLSQTLGRTSST